MDMAGFAINIASFLDKPDAKMGFKISKGHRIPVKDGHLETDFLENFASRETVECRGSDKEVGPLSLVVSSLVKIYYQC